MEPIAVRTIVQTVSYVVVNVFPVSGSPMWLVLLVGIGGVLLGSLLSYLIAGSSARRQHVTQMKVANMLTARESQREIDDFTEQVARSTFAATKEEDAPREGSPSSQG